MHSHASQQAITGLPQPFIRQIIQSEFSPT